MGRRELWSLAVVSRLTRTLCLVLGGHDWQGPRIAEGRMRLVCSYGCGAMSDGIETRGQEMERAQRTVRPFLNLIVSRDTRARRIA